MPHANGPSVKTTKKPVFPDPNGRVSSAQPPSRRSISSGRNTPESTGTKIKRKSVGSAFEYPGFRPPRQMGRPTNNSLGTDPPDYKKSRIPPPNTEICTPEPPSRSPTPPTEVLPFRRAGGKGNRFTEKDRSYFINFISWHLSQDPHLSRSELAAMLAEKAFTCYSSHAEIYAQP